MNIRPSEKLLPRLLSAAAVACLVWACGCRSLAPADRATACHDCSASGPAESRLLRCEFKSAHMGTLFFITVYAPSVPDAEAAADAAFGRIAALEDVMSDYQADSELNLFRDHPTGSPRELSPDLFNVLSRSRQLSRMTDGAFDVTIGPYVRLWRFSRKRGLLPTAGELAAAREAVGWRHLRLDPKSRTGKLLVPGMRLDLGGIAKGYAADAALKVLRERGFDRALVAASGDIAVGNPPPGERGWKIAISGPGASTNSDGRTLLLANAAVSTSGDSEQFVEIDGQRYSHIVSPFTGLGLTQRIQATIVAPNATTTDALATSVCVLGPRRGLAVVKRSPGVEALVFTREQGKWQVNQSEDFEKLTLSGKGLYSSNRAP